MGRMTSHIIMENEKCLKPPTRKCIFPSTKSSTYMTNRPLQRRRLRCWRIWWAVGPWLSCPFYYGAVLWPMIRSPATKQNVLLTQLWRQLNGKSHIRRTWLAHLPGLMGRKTSLPSFVVRAGCDALQPGKATQSSLQTDRLTIFKGVVQNKR